MPNRIKKSAGGLALQITIEARKSGLVVEDTEGTATRRAEVYVYGFDDLLLLVDREHVAVSHRTELVAAAARDTGSIHRGEVAMVEIAGNGYQIQLPGCRDAGFEVGDNAPVAVGNGVIAIHNESERRLAEDLLSIRTEQVSS
ncbi:hypothetical protein [Halonotius pteroides]|uniref:Uncharacterized protein n=1 Tax=Halonotius pteroides TaxID=268735 RepID=A0A3A6PX96_9EURY|nr:hypothetical protein [Halonotius pteroides]RJX47788.1 hypothetical protein DP106_14110 [Halonotius pteroides]